jgi:hypothetical protein
MLFHFGFHMDLKLNVIDFLPYNKIRKIKVKVKLFL